MQTLPLQSHSGLPFTITIACAKSNIRAEDVVKQEVEEEEEEGGGVGGRAEVLEEQEVL